MTSEGARAGGMPAAPGMDGFRLAVRRVLQRERAPEALRAHIAAMLAVEARQDA